MTRLARATRVSIAYCGCVLAGGCTEGATDSPAPGALMQVQGAQFVRGAMPEVSDGAPSVASIDLLTNTIWRGEIDKPLAGALGASATAAALALSGDDGYWIVTAGVPDFSAPTLPTFQATASFATNLTDGAYSLQVRAVDANGAFGPSTTQTLTALATSPSAPAPQGVLVVTLTWDTESDLDLHVVEPSGNEIYHGAPIAFSADGGISGELDFDSNANCVIDGRREEDVTFADTPPSGQYLVRVDAASLCGQPDAYWTVRATLRGVSLGVATGEALDGDTWGPHDRGAGILALQFDVP